MSKQWRPIVGAVFFGLGLIACSSETPTPTPATPTSPPTEVPSAPEPAPEAKPKAPETSEKRDPRLPKDPTQFRAARDGFSFPNYGREKKTVDLTPETVEQLCGPSSCVRGTGSSCILTGALRIFMDSINASMGGGHCEGLTMLSQAIYMDHIPLTRYDARVRSTFGLQLSSRTLQSDVAFFGAMMSTHPGGTSEQKLTPNQVLAELRKKNKSYGLGIYKRNGKSGHAVVAIKVIDTNDGKSFIDIYDSNSPGSEEDIKVNTAKNTWSYDDYKGDAKSKTMTLLPLSARLVKQQCSASGNADDSDDRGYFSRRWQIWLDGPGSIDEPSGAQVISRRSFEERSLEPMYVIEPQDTELTIRGADSVPLENSSVSVIHRGLAFLVEGLSLKPGETDKLLLSKDGNSLTYKSADSESLTLRIGATYSKDDFEITIIPVVKSGFELQVRNVMDKVASDHVLELRLENRNKTPASYSAELTRISAEKDEHFLHRNILINAQDTHRLQYGKWLKDKQPLSIMRDKSTLSLEDKS